MICILQKILYWETRRCVSAPSLKLSEHRTMNTEFSEHRTLVFPLSPSHGTTGKQHKIKPSLKQQGWQCSSVSPLQGSNSSLAWISTLGTVHGDRFAEMPQPGFAFLPRGQKVIPLCIPSLYFLNVTVIYF